jgi:pimeloyl-ACP methyl ester carboxylesterase
MIPDNRAKSSRRTILVGAGMAAAAGVVAPPRARAEAGAVNWSSQYQAVKHRDGEAVELAVYRRRRSAPAAGDAVLPVLFLVHGSSSGAMSSYDLQVPGKGSEYSMMDVFAGFGFDVWTMDHEGYGKSARTAGNSDIASGVADLQVASDLVRRETGQDRMHVFGESSGALRAGAFAMAAPDRVGRLILEAFTWTGAGSPTLGKRAEAVAEYRAHNRRPRDRAMLESIFTRDHPGTTDPAVAAAFVAAELPYGDSVPSGTYLDMTANLPVVDPLKVYSPVLILRGEFDGIAALDDLLGFYARLPNADRQFAIIPGAAHSIILSVAHRAMFHVVQAFLTQPAPLPA